MRYTTTGRNNFLRPAESHRHNALQYGKTVLFRERQPDRVVPYAAWFALAVLFYFAAQFAR